MSAASPRFDPAPDSRPDDVVWPQLAWPVPDDTVLVGEIVTLRPARPMDSVSMFAALDHDEVWEHVPGRPSSPAQWRSGLGVRTDAGWLVWTVTLAREVGGLGADTVVGTTSYLDASVVHARLEIGSTAYHPAVWGTAVNPATKLLLLGHAFDTLGAGRVQLKTDVRNVRSQQAIAGLGARFEGVLRRYQRRDDGSVRDTALFSITAEDWPEVRTGLERRLADPTPSTAIAGNPS